MRITARFAHQCFRAVVALGLAAFASLLPARAAD
jgi:ABC-type lipoprotein release transport system permease subunit